LRFEALDVGADQPHVAADRSRFERADRRPVPSTVPLIVLNTSVVCVPMFAR
jgi:hypothetical protein